MESKTKELLAASGERWAVVTGASSGIGKATALALAADGWNVGVHYCRNEFGAQAVSQTVFALGKKSFLLPADFGEIDQAGHATSAAWEITGGVDAWVHFAGVDVLTGPAAKWSFQQKLERLTRVDLWGTIHACRAIGHKMFAAGRGSIVTVGWDQASTGMEGDSGQLFASIKAGVSAFTRSLAKTLAPAVRVNCIAPGWIKTAWGEGASQAWQDRVLRETPLARWGTANDIAAAVSYLVSDAAAFTTGQTLNINGGAVMT